MKLVASCAFGLEAVVARELQAMQRETQIVGPGQIEFSGEWPEITQANIWLRCADRVSIVLQEFDCTDFDCLFETVREHAWSEWLPEDAMIHVTGNSVKSQLTSVPAIQRTVKKAIVENLLRTWQGQTLPETGHRFRIHIGLRDNHARLTLDTTGASLHKRGYREIATRAPLKETLAAALVQLSFWSPGRPLVDPFCGGGTILIEAAMIGRNLAPGRNRSFASEHWPNLPDNIWADTREAAKQAEQLEPLSPRLIGYDIHSGALSLARRNAQAAGVAEDIHFQVGDFAQLTSKKEYGAVITNPPYGERIDSDELRSLYESIPFVLRGLPTWSHFILTAYPQFEQLIGKQADRRRKLYNGRIECTYYQFHGPKPPRARLREDEAREDEAKEDEAKEVQPKEVQPKEVQPREARPKEAPPTTAKLGEGPLEKIKPSHNKTSPSTTSPSTTSPSTTSPSTTSPSTTSSSTTSSITTSPINPSQRPESQTAVFGGQTRRGSEQAEIFASRLRKRAKHLRRWPTKRGITCFRLYERDVPEIPFIVDRYEDHLHMIELERPHDRDLAQHANWLEIMAATAAEALDIAPENVHLKTRLRQRGLQQHTKLADTSQEMVVREGGLQFWVNLEDYTDTGLFLDHRAARNTIREISQGKRVLNLFAYTGAFSVYAADGKASHVTTVDWSNTYLDWARRNFKLNGFVDSARYRFVRADAREYVQNAVERDEFDLIVCDPPTFSNSKRTEDSWDVQRHHAELLRQLLSCTSAGGSIFFSTNFRRIRFESDAIPQAEIREITKQTLPEEYRNRRIHRSWLLRKSSG